MRWHIGVAHAWSRGAVRDTAQALKSAEAMGGAQDLSPLPTCARPTRARIASRISSHRAPRRLGGAGVTLDVALRLATRPPNLPVVAQPPCAGA